MNPIILDIGRRMTPSELRGTIYIPFFGIEVSHEPEFLIDRPTGIGEYIFVHFQSPVFLRGITGEQQIPANRAVLWTPGVHQWYSSIHCELHHSWFHCIGPGVVECIERFSIPVNCVLDMGRFEHLVPFLQEVRREQLRQEPFWEEAVSLRTHAFFLALGRAVHPIQEPHITPYQQEMRATLRHVRETVHSNLVHPWRVEEMAELAHLSGSRFTTLYSQFFGKSPLNDLLEARLHRASSLLKQTTFSVVRIANDSGFGSIAHFSRLFRQKMGCAPSRFRQAGAAL